MKFIKKLLLLNIFVLLSVFFIKPAPAQTADAVIDSTAFSYVTISKYGQKLSLDNFKTVDNTSYIITNDNLTISIKPLDYEYNINLDEYSDEYIVSTTTFNIELNESTPEPDDYNDYFITQDEQTGEEKKLYFRYNSSNGTFNLYSSSPTQNTSVAPIISSSRSNVIWYSDADKTITIINSYTVKSSTEDAYFNFTVRVSNANRSYSLAFLRPVINFANSNTEELIRFKCNGIDAGNSEFVNETLPKEYAYNSVQVDFLNNNYTEENPLYFNINFNGFIYCFELYSKVYDSENLLFVNYIDTEKLSNNKYLATALYTDASGQQSIDTNNLVYAMNGTEFNEFSLLFQQTGRYEIEFYDSTYLLGINQPNYYITSFYIRDNAKSAFENIYIIAQTLDNDGNEIEYIVSTSTLNNSVKTTIKNLNNFGTDSSGAELELDDVIGKIEIKQTTFGGSTNIPTITEYFAADIESKLNNGDFEILFESDAYYQITIYNSDSTKTIYYELTIVKHAKKTFTIPLVDENGEPVFEEDGGKQKSDTYEAKTPFKTEIINYSKNILSTMDLKTQFSISAIPHSSTLNKTYINNYNITYGVEQVDIEKIEHVFEEGETKFDCIHLTFKGVGDMIVTVTVNGKTTTHNLNYEKGKSTLCLSEYGTYTIKLVDSMGTEKVKIYKLEKKMNTSALLLIGLSAFIVVVIVLFVLKARAKIPTR